MRKVGYVLGDSEIHGKGMFTLKKRKKGTRVYASEIDAPTRRYGINHSCDPTVIKTKEGEWVYARDVKAGEEVTVSYGSTLPFWNFKCNCPVCRKESK